jgi:hypothetical protein
MRIESGRLISESGTQLLRCIDCGKEFAFPRREQEFFRSKGFTPPRRCKPCRLDHKEGKDKKLV